MAMLTWQQDHGGWVSNGYRIELLEPFRWVLLSNDTRAVRAVSDESVPLAEARTLTLCKREAELWDMKGRREAIRRRMWGRLTMALAAFVMLPSLTSPWDLISFLVLLTVAAGAGGFLAGTYVAGSDAAAGDSAPDRASAGDARFTLWVTRYGGRSRVGM